MASGMRCSAPFTFDSLQTVTTATALTKAGLSLSRYFTLATCDTWLTSVSDRREGMDLQHLIGVTTLCVGKSRGEGEMRHLANVSQ